MASRFNEIGRKVSDVIGFVGITALVGMILFAMSIETVAPYIDKSPYSGVSALLDFLACLGIGAGAAYWHWRTRKWREANPTPEEIRAAEYAEKRRLANEAAGIKEPNPILEELRFFFGMVVQCVAGVVALAILGAVLYFGYFLLAGLPIAIAIIIGAVIIGLAILALGSQ